MNDKPIRTRYHRIWEAKVREITKGLTILTPVKGQWLSPTGELFVERMIPVRLACSREDINRIAALSAVFYNQQAIMFYLVSSEVHVKHYK